MLQAFSPPVQQILEITNVAIEIKNSLVTCIERVEALLESLQAISDEWNVIKDSDMGLEEYDIRYEAMLDVSAALQKQTRNRKRAEGVVEELKTQYTLSCQAVDQEYLRLFQIGSKFFPEVLPKLKEICGSEDMICFSRHFGSYESPKIIHSAKHKVYSASYNGVECVLKEFYLDEAKDLSRFLRES